MSILVEEKLRNLSATARKCLLAILTSIVMRAVEVREREREAVRERVREESAEREEEVFRRTWMSPLLVTF